MIKPRIPLSERAIARTKELLALRPGTGDSDVNPMELPTATPRWVLEELLKMVESTSDGRTVNNIMRHEYRVLSDAEKKSMQFVKDRGLELAVFLDALGASREVSLAKTKIEEAVMWAVKHITK